MAKVKLSRDSKQQLGQFMTPYPLVQSVLSQSDTTLTKTSKILEPSLGLGAFVFGLIEQLLPLYPDSMTQEQKIHKILRDNLYGVEYDPQLFLEFKQLMLDTYAVDLDQVPHNFVIRDFFRYEPTVKFDFIIGNPPFGGSFDPEIEDELDQRYGQWREWKIKKETYAFFTIICLGMLTEGGVLSFILSDTFLTISTMEGLRRCAFNYGEVTITTLDHFSDETKYGMAVLSVKSGSHVRYITFNEEKIRIEDIANTPNYSWKINATFAKYFKGRKLGDFVLASSGMTVGKNELFLRKITQDSSITEPYDFAIVDEPITLENEIKRARLGKISENKKADIREQETRGATRKVMAITPKAEPMRIALPNKDYRFYNKAVNAQYYAHPHTVIYWKNDGEAVYTFKKSGPWYLHGIGGKPFFKKEGLTWNLIATSIKARYLPEGYILDSGAPIATLRPDIARKELWFILGWINTQLATDILKVVINHTKNIQSKDIEKMPYPEWVSAENKREAVRLVQKLVTGLRDGTLSAEAKLKKIESLEKLYSYKK